jgi:hypothetical protein
MKKASKHAERLKTHILREITYNFKQSMSSQGNMYRNLVNAKIKK